MNNLNGNRKNEFRRKQEEKQRKLALKIEDEAGELREGSLKSEEAIPSLEGPFDNGLIFQRREDFSRNLLTASKIDDLHRRIVRAVGKEQNFKFGRLAVTVDTGLLKRHITVGLDIDTECFHKMNPFNDTSGRERAPAA